MHCRAETLAATDEASPRPLAMAEERRKQEWGEADDEGLRGVVGIEPRARSTSHMTCACHSLCIVHAANVAQGLGIVGRMERRFPSEGSK